MRVLKSGLTGPDVKRWEIFLVGQGFDPGPVDGVFDGQAEAATREFQTKHRLDIDGKVGNETLGKAMTLGFEMVRDGDTDRFSANFPPPPAFAPLVGTVARQRVFGKFEFVHKPKPNNKENIEILGTWERDNIVRVALPQLVGIKGAPADGGMRVHRLAAPQLQALFKAWEKAKLLDRILTYDGAFVPRFVRGSTTALSNHAFGSAFDLNAALNPLGAQPALVGQKGSLRELALLANEHGFYWGGHFKSRRDGMHFEVAELK